jgi:hypothetical protein
MVAAKAGCQRVARHIAHAAAALTHNVAIQRRTWVGAVIQAVLVRREDAVQQRRAEHLGRI